MSVVVRKVVNANPGLHVNRNNDFSCIEIPVFYMYNILCSSRLLKQYDPKTSPKSYKTKIEILVNSRLAQSGFEQHGPED